MNRSARAGANVANLGQYLQEKKRRDQDSKDQKIRNNLLNLLTQTRTEGAGIQNQAAQFQLNEMMNPPEVEPTFDEMLEKDKIANFPNLTSEQQNEVRYGIKPQKQDKPDKPSAFTEKLDKMGDLYKQPYGTPASEGDAG